MSSNQAEIHNKLAAEIVTSVTKTVFESGGDTANVLVLLETVVTGVLLTLSEVERWSEAERETALRKLSSRVRSRFDEIDRAKAAKR